MAAPRPGRVRFRRHVASCAAEPLHTVLEPIRPARHRPDLVDCGVRLLLDPYLCVGPGCEAHAATLFAISQHCAQLGITLCVERQAWLEVERDPDVVRRRVDLSRFEPVVKLDPLGLPSERDAGALFVTPRSETDVADLKLLGALHARVAHLLLALDGRIHELAAEAGFQSRVLTPADARDWLETLQGKGRAQLLRELDPHTAIAPGALAELIRDECEPYDPYLRGRLGAGRGRVFGTFAGDQPLAFGVIESGGANSQLELVALAARDAARGSRVIEPIVSAALGMARRRGVPLVAFLPPHDEMVLRLLEDIGFRRGAADPHGRVRLLHPVEPPAPRLAEGGTAWILPLDAGAHDQLLPEMSGAAQAQLFAVGADSRPQTLGSPVRKQLVLAAGSGSPAPGDLLMFFHGRAARRPGSASLTCVARVDRTQHCETLADVLALNAARPGYSLAELQSRLSAGPVAVIDASMLGRLERFVTLGRLKDLGIVGAAPRALRPLQPQDWERLSACLSLA